MNGQSSSDTLSEGREGERTPRPSIVRETSGTSTQDERSPRSRYPGRSDRRVLSRDFADEHRLRHARSTAVSFRQPSIHHRYGSTRPSPSPAPSQSWKFMDDRRSVAIGSVDDAISRKFSLAGPAPAEALHANQPYIDPGYAQLNPAYDQPSNIRPVWGLAKPLPHVLRSGMVPTKDELEEDEHDPPDLENGRIEPSLRPGRIAPQLDEVRRIRELQLYESFHDLHSPVFSPFARPHRGSPARIPDMHLNEAILEEDEERYDPDDPDLSGVSESVSKVNRAKEEQRLLMSAFGDDEIHNLHTYWSVMRLRFREPFAEFLGVSGPISLLSKIRTPACPKK